jgi:hypothetical protein
LVDQVSKNNGGDYPHRKEPNPRSNVHYFRQEKTNSASGVS